MRNGAAAVILKIFWYAPGLKSTHVLTNTATLLINYTVRTDNINNSKNLNHVKIFWYAPGLKSTHVLTKTATLLINYTVRTDNINNLKNLNHVLISNIEIYINMVRRREKITKNSPGTI